MENQTLKRDLKAAVNILIKKQKLVTISTNQFVQLESIVLRRDSFHQLPTGSGKTWAAIRLKIFISVIFKMIYFHFAVP